MSVAIEHVDDAAERLGITADELRAAVAAGELRFRSALPDHLAIADVNAWGRGRGLIADAPVAPKHSITPVLAIVPASASSSTVPGSSSPAMVPARSAALESAARQLGLDADEVIANARAGERRAGQRTPVKYTPSPWAPPPLEFGAPTRSPEVRELRVPAPADTVIANVADQLELDRAEVARSTAPLDGGGRRRRVEIDYPNRIGPEDLK